MREEEIVKIPVTKHHVENSDRYQEKSCMVSNAVREALDLDPTKYRIETTYTSTAIKAKTKRGGWKSVFRRKHSADESSRIKAFDMDEGVEPFEIDWKLPGDWREQLLKARDYGM